MGIEEIIYGIDNGASYTVEHIDKDNNITAGEQRTHWAPVLEITSDERGRGVWVTITPVDEHGKQQVDRLQTIELTRHGANRAIKALRRHRDRVFGRDE